MRHKRADLSFAAVALLYCASIWWPTCKLPFHWDGAMFVARAAHDLLARDFSPFVLRFSDFAHPPLFVAALALGWKALGNGVLAGHLLVAPFLPLLLLSTYAVGVRLYGRSVAIAATALTATAPVVAAEYGQVYFDLPLAGLLMLGLALWLAGRRWTAALVLGISMGIKIPAIVFPCALLVVGLTRREERGRLWPLATPLLVLVTWLLYHHAVAGYWLSVPGRRAYLPHSVWGLIGNYGMVGAYVLAQKRWLIALLGLLASLDFWRRRRAWSELPRLDPGTLTLATIVLGGVLFFALAGEFAQRYGIMLLPETALLAVAGLHLVLRPRRGLYWAAIALCCGLQLRDWLPPQRPATHFQYRPDADLHYLDMIALGRATAQYMEREHPNAIVFGSWPERYWLSEPYFGYVRRPFAVFPCKRYRPDMPGEKLIFGTLYAPGARTCWKLIRALDARPIKKLSYEAKWVQIHLAP